MTAFGRPALAFGTNTLTECVRPNTVHSAERSPNDGRKSQLKQCIACSAKPNAAEQAAECSADPNKPRIGTNPWAAPAAASSLHGCLSGHAMHVLVLYGHETKVGEGRPAPR